jgi:hypothetical protein
MSGRTLGRGVSLAAVSALCAAYVVPALAHTGGGHTTPQSDPKPGEKPVPTKATIKAKGKVTMRANRFIKDTSRFSRRVTVIKHDGTITLKNKTRQDHTLSIVRKRDLARRASDLEKCFGKGVCDEIVASHGITEDGASDPTKSLIDGGDGFNKPYDSIVLPAKGKVRFEVTAEAGKTLRFMCAFHPQMQGKLKLR